MKIKLISDIRTTVLHVKDVLLTLKAYCSIFRIKAAEGFQYRAAALAGGSISLFWVWIEITIYSIFYHYASNSEAGAYAGLSLRQVITYTWMGQILFLMQPTSIDGEILSKITSGDVGIELCRPLHLYYYWLAKNAAIRFIPLIWRGSILLLASFLVPAAYRPLLPASPAGFFLFVISLLSAFLLCTVFAAFVCSVRLNITWGEGPTYIIMLIASVLSGAYLPLQLWPQALQPFLLLQPFAGYLDIPLRLYLGTLSPKQAVGALLVQLVWILGFMITGKRILELRIRKVIVQGG